MLLSPTLLSQAILRSRFAGAALRGQNVGQVTVRFGEGGLEPERRFYFVLRAINGAGREQQKAEAIVGFGVTGIGRDRLLKVVCALRVIAARGQEIPRAGVLEPC